MNLTALSIKSKVKSRLTYMLLLCCSLSLFSQSTDTLTVKKNDKVVVVTDDLIQQAYDPLSPSRAAFYSAVVPGLGQAYNKKYWKIPIIYAGMAAGVYFYIQNDNDYDRFRNAFKRRLEGFTDDEFFDVNGDGQGPDITLESLQSVQENVQRTRDLWLVLTIVWYSLNIIEANVTAHLAQYNVSTQLSFDFQPYLELNPITNDPNYGMALVFKF